MTTFSYVSYMISLVGLNEPQRQAAEAVEGPVLILAGAGSGKTRTITYRISHMVSNLGIKPTEILGVSFTNKAAKEMKERVIGLLGKQKSRRVTLTTFHRLGVQILRSDITKLGYHQNFSIYDTSDQLAIVREALKKYHAEKKFDTKQVHSKIGLLKNSGISEEDFLKSNYFDEDDPYDLATEYAYHFYQDKLRFYNAIDFDDIIFLAVKIFKDFPEVAEKFSKKFKYIMVDEYQDTNGLQLELIMGLTKEHNNLCVVGDDDQSIYAFRGADLSNILEFEKNYPGAKVIKLEENYRSTDTILELANKVIISNKSRKEKTLWTKKLSEVKPLVWIMGDTDHEAACVVEDIVQHQSSGGFLGEIAILYRSKTQVQPFEDELVMSQVPYTIVGGQKYYEKKEIKDLIAYMSVLNNPDDQISLRRIFNIPNRGIGTQTLKKYLALADEKECSLFEALKINPALDPNREKYIVPFIDLIETYQEKFKNYSLVESLSTFIEDIGFLEFVEKSYDNAKQVERRKKDIMHFIETAGKFTKFHGEHATLKGFVQRLLLQDSQDEEDLDEDDDVRKNEVTLMTLHSSKGLEFDQVYFVGVEEELLPHKRTVAEGEDISEERRLCYVGITRAREKLVMTYCKERRLFGREVPRLRSRFLHHLEPYFDEQDRTNFGHLSKEEADQYKSNFFQGLMDDLDGNDND